jgi:hypothetical protein
VRARWISPSVDERWEIAAGRLRLIGALERSLRAEPLATWAPHTGDFAWLTPRPVADEGPFLRPELVLEMGPALELVSFAATRAGARMEWRRPALRCVGCGRGPVAGRLRLRRLCSLRGTSRGSCGHCQLRVGLRVLVTIVW